MCVCVCLLDWLAGCLLSVSQSVSQPASRVFVCFLVSCFPASCLLSRVSMASGIRLGKAQQLSRWAGMTCATATV
ncbi:hypothetical protein LZ30DRAFT_699361 [Colletotrichum cereale]|nr:hypothetical protein LZ30DRAFT_699361 [Colletotrichum cereale]